MRYEQRLEATIVLPLPNAGEDPEELAKALRKKLEKQFPLATVKVEWQWRGTVVRG